LNTIPNNLSNITLLNSAVSDVNGYVDFSSEGSMGSSAVSIVGDFRGEIVKVKCLTLESIAEENQLKCVDFVKMDIEGFEVQVLAGAESFFKQYKPIIVVEPHIVDGVLSDKKVMEILEKFGYECTLIQQYGVNLPLITGRFGH